MANKTEIAIASLALVCLLLFEAVYPYGFLYPYLFPQQQEETYYKKKRPIIIPPYVGLSPQKVAETNASDATRDTYQRKVFYDIANFFVVYWTGAPTRQIRYVASPSGVTWTNPFTLWTFSVAPYYGGNVDIQYPNKGAKDLNGLDFDLEMVFSGSNGNSFFFYPFRITNTILSQQNGAGNTIGGGSIQGGSVAANLAGVNIAVYHPRDFVVIGIWTARATSTGVPYGGTSTGGAQILPYKTSSPYYMLVLAKGGDDKLYYSRVKDDASAFLDAFTPIATLSTGFSDFCAASEAQNIGDPERVHLVYIKSTGELCYRKFENDAWSSEKVLVSSGPSYPVIAAGKGGRLYVFYVKDGKIWLIKYDGTNWRDPIEFWTDQHTYNNPAYLSTNQNVQGGKICLVWTEGTASPYEVWFSYIEDT
jgi:hypothetical protein